MNLLYASFKSIMGKLECVKVYSEKRPISRIRTGDIRDRSYFFFLFISAEHEI